MTKFGCKLADCKSFFLLPEYDELAVILTNIIIDTIFIIFAIHIFYKYNECSWATVIILPHRRRQKTCNNPITWSTRNKEKKVSVLLWVCVQCIFIRMCWGSISHGHGQTDLYFSNEIREWKVCRSIETSCLATSCNGWKRKPSQEGSSNFCSFQFPVEQDKAAKSLNFFRPRLP